MEYSKQKLLLALLVKFEISFNKQINESVVNQEVGQYLKTSVDELVQKQYRGSLFDKKIEELISRVDSERLDNKLVLNDYSSRLWTAILEIIKRTTSFETAYSLIDILGEKNTSLKL